MASLVQRLDQIMTNPDKLAKVLFLACTALQRKTRERRQNVTVLREADSWVCQVAYHAKFTGSLRAWP